MQPESEPLYFATPDEWRQWLAAHHAERQELWVGFYKKGSGQPSITWPQSVDQALCFGWIDGVRKSVDADRYRIRFTPRRRGSMWSNVNIGRVAELTELGLMQPAGLAAFEQRKGERSGVYSFENKDQIRLDPAHEATFRANPAAWAHWEVQPPWYRRAAMWWITSAKQESTRLRRLATLIESSAAGRTIPPLTRPQTKG